MRPSKNVHILARLRHELGDLRQQDVAERIGIKADTLHRIETGRRNLTYKLAERIGDTFGVDPRCLTENNLERGLRTRDGHKWTAKTRREIQNRLKRWGDLEPFVRQSQKTLHGALLYQYLEISQLIRRLPNPSDQLYRWSQLFRLAKAVLAYSEPATKTWTGTEYFCHDKLETIVDDVQSILSEARIIKRLEKRAKHNRQARDPKLEIKLAYAGIFGFDKRGLIANKLIEELSVSEFENMQISDFDDLVNERCKKEGVPIPERFDPFEAMRNYCAHVTRHSARK
jgi:transcriptional regulator with XRE-family HTH domain